MDYIAIQWLVCMTYRFLALSQRFNHYQWLYLLIVWGALPSRVRQGLIPVKPLCLAIFILRLLDLPVMVFFDSLKQPVDLISLSVIQFMAMPSFLL